MSYGPVNRKTLASVNRVNRGVQDSDLQEPQDPGESNDNLNTIANTPMYKKLNELAKKLYGVAYENLIEERQRAIREEAAESNDAIGQHEFVPLKPGPNAGPCKVCGKLYKDPIHKFQEGEL